MSRALILVAVLARGAAAQPAADVSSDVTIDKAVEMYRVRNPRLTAQRAAIDVTAADLIDAGIYPNPSIGVSGSTTVHGTATSGETLEQAELDIPILLGKRGARERAAEHRIATTRADVATSVADGVREVRHRFVALLAAQERVAAMTAAIDEIKKIRAIVAGRKEAGAKSPYDLERTDLAVATVESRLAEATSDQLAAATALAAAVGIPSWQPHAAGTFRPASEAPPSVIAADHPALAKPIAAAAQARSEEELAHAEARPTPSLALSGYNTTGPTGIAVTLGVSLPLPLFDRNQGAVARARAQAHAAELDRGATAFELGAQLDRAARIYAAQKDTLAKFEAGAMERLPRIRTMAEDAYRSGQGGIVELLDALDAISDARLRDIELVEAVLESEVDLRAAALGQ